jgi:hypothetical protein
VAGRVLAYISYSRVVLVGVPIPIVTQLASYSSKMGTKQLTPTWFFKDSYYVSFKREVKVLPVFVDTELDLTPFVVNWRKMAEY